MVASESGSKYYATEHRFIVFYICKQISYHPMAYKKYSIKHKKELYYIFLIVVVGGILFLSIVGPDGYLDLQKVRMDLQMQKERVEERERDINERINTIEALRSDKEAIEQYAREKGYGRDNDIIQQLPENSEEAP